MRGSYGFDIRVFFILVSLVSLLFSGNKKYYQKTVDAYGEKYATELFKKIKRGGCVLLIVASFWLMYLIILDWKVLSLIVLSVFT